MSHELCHLILLVTNTNEDVLMGYFLNRFQPVNMEQDKVKSVIEQLIKDQDYKKAFNTLSTSSEYANACMAMSKAQQLLLQKHVSTDKYIKAYKVVVVTFAIQYIYNEF